MIINVLDLEFVVLTSPRSSVCGSGSETSERPVTFGPVILRFRVKEVDSNVKVNKLYFLISLFFLLKKKFSCTYLPFWS